MVSQPSLINEFGTNETPCLKKQTYGAYGAAICMKTYEEQPVVDNTRSLEWAHEKEVTTLNFSTLVPMNISVLKGLRSKHAMT